MFLIIFGSIPGFLIDCRTVAAFDSPVRIFQPEIHCRADQKWQQLINKLLQEECLGQGSSVHVLLVKTEEAILTHLLSPLRMQGNGSRFRSTLLELITLYHRANLKFSLSSGGGTPLMKGKVFARAAQDGLQIIQDPPTILGVTSEQTLPSVLLLVIDVCMILSKKFDPFKTIYSKPLLL